MRALLALMFMCSAIWGKKFLIETEDEKVYVALYYILSKCVNQLDDQSLIIALREKNNHSLIHLKQLQTSRICFIPPAPPYLSFCPCPPSFCITLRKNENKCSHLFKTASGRRDPVWEWNCGSYRGLYGSMEVLSWEKFPVQYGLLQQRDSIIPSKKIQYDEWVPRYMWLSTRCRERKVGNLVLRPLWWTLQAARRLGCRYPHFRARPRRGQELLPILRPSQINLKTAFSKL